MADAGPTLELLETWLRPIEALAMVVRDAYPEQDVAANAIYQRLQGGRIIAAAKSTTWGDSGLPLGPSWIPAGYWSDLSGGIASKRAGDWWMTSDARFFLRSTSHHTSRTVRAFGIRLDPAGVGELIADALPYRPPAAPSPQSDDLRTAQEKTDVAMAELERAYEAHQGATRNIPSASAEAAKKPSLSPAHLQAWWTFYKTVTPADRDTEEEALAHVARCFPEQSVTRTRIRELRGSGKPGPKGRPAE